MNELAWVDIHPFVWQAVSRPWEIRTDDKPYERKYNLWARGVEVAGPLIFLGHEWMDTLEEAQALAERLQSVLDAPLGTSLPETAEQDRLNRVKAFVTNLKQAEKPFSDGFVIDGVLAIIDDDIHLEVIDFSPPSEQDIAWAQKVAEKLGLERKL